MRCDRERLTPPRDAERSAANIPTRTMAGGRTDARYRKPAVPYEYAILSLLPSGPSAASAAEGIGLSRRRRRASLSEGGRGGCTTGRVTIVVAMEGDPTAVILCKMTTVRLK